MTRASTLHRATQPTQVWSWDITWLQTTVRGLYLYLYLVMEGFPDAVQAEIAAAR